MSRAAHVKKAADTLQAFLSLPRASQTPRAAITALGSVASSSESRASLRGAAEALDRLDAALAQLDKGAAKTPTADWAKWNAALEAPGVVSSYEKAHAKLVADARARNKERSSESASSLLAKAARVQREFAERARESGLSARANLDAAEFVEERGKVLTGISGDFPELSVAIPTERDVASTDAGRSARDAMAQALEASNETAAAVARVRGASEKRVAAAERQVAAADREMDMLLKGTISQWIEAHPEEARMLFDEIEQGDWGAEIDEAKADKYAEVKERVRAAM